MALLKTAEEIQKIAQAGAILKQVVIKLLPSATAGVSLKDLDALTRRLIAERGAQPAFLGYKPYGARKPYPAAICTSLNDVVVHGPPTARRLAGRDVLKIDLGVKNREYYADTAITVGIGEISEEARKLITATEEALQSAIACATPRHTLGDIGFAVSSCVRKHGFAVVEGLTGHGIGRELHEEPSVFNEGKPGAGLRLQAGMVLAIEVMVSAGSPKIKQLPDDSYATVDGSLSAHFEHTVVITDSEPMVIT